MFMYFVLFSYYFFIISFNWFAKIVVFPHPDAPIIISNIFLSEKKNFFTFIIKLIKYHLSCLISLLYLILLFCLNYFMLILKVYSIILYHLIFIYLYYINFIYYLIQYISLFFCLKIYQQHLQIYHLSFYQL